MAASCTFTHQGRLIGQKQQGEASSSVKKANVPEQLVIQKFFNGECARLQCGEDATCHGAGGLAPGMSGRKLFEGLKNCQGCLQDVDFDDKMDMSCLNHRPDEEGIKTPHS